MVSRLEWIGGEKVNGAAIGSKRVIDHFSFGIFHFPFAPVRTFEDRTGQNDCHQGRLVLN